MDRFADPAQADAARPVSDVRLTHMEWAAYLAAAKQPAPTRGLVPRRARTTALAPLRPLASKARHAATGMGWRLQ